MKKNYALGIRKLLLLIIVFFTTYATTKAQCGAGQDIEPPQFTNTINGEGTLVRPFVNLLPSTLSSVPSGRYYFMFNGVIFLGQLDNSTDGGGWLMIVNYVHKGGDNSALQVRNTDVPLLISSTLGDDEAGTENWGHIGNTMAKAIDFQEMRFYGATSGHARILNFKTTHTAALQAVKTGKGSFDGIENNFTSLTGHTANIPVNATREFSDLGDATLTEFPFFWHGRGHWGIRGRGYRWEMDDFANSINNHTIHRVWVRGSISPRGTAIPITAQLDAMGNVAITAADFGLNTKDNCAGAITQTLSQTNFDCSHIGQNVVQLTATDQSGNSNTIDVIVVVEDTTQPNVVCQDITVQLDDTGNAMITVADIDNGSTDNCAVDTIVLSQDTFDCTMIGDHTITLTITDVNGNQASCTAAVTVEDKIAPVVSGLWGTGTQTDPFTTLSEGFLKYLPSGRYYFKFNITTFQAELDNDTDEGAWLMVLNYVHIAGDNTNLEIRNNNLPLLDSSTLGDNEAGTTNWGHIGNTLAAEIDFKELRFYGKTTGHNREIHFKTQYVRAISYIKTGTGNFHGMNHENFTNLAAHTANLPQQMGWGFSNQGDLALTNFPFYLGGQYVWGIKGSGGRWEVDDAAGNSQSTIHRVWVRGDKSPVAELPSVIIQLDAAGNTTLSPTAFGLTVQDNCAGMSIQTLSKTTFDCTDLGKNTIQFHASDASGNTRTIDVIVVVEDPIAPVITCSSDVIVGTDLGTCEAVITPTIPQVTDNCILPPATISGFTTIGVKGGSTYYVSNANFTSARAIADARTRGGFVATIETVEEDQFISDFQTAQNIGDIMIGFYDPTFDGNFIWLSESTATYTNWAPGEPNNIGADIYTEKLSNGTWNNIPYHEEQPYVLEIKGGIERTDALVGQNTFPIGDHIFEYKITDAFGNTDSCSYTITVEDATAPVVNCVAPFTVQLDVSGNAAITASDIDNGSTDTCGVATTSIDKTTFDCTQLGDHRVTLTVTDIHGNQESCSTTVTVTDDTPPLFKGPWGTGTLGDPFTSISANIVKEVPSGRYYFTFNNNTFIAELDNDTDGGGWVMVLNYVHSAGENPDLLVRNTDLPLLNSTVLGNDESATKYWGHIGNTLASTIDFDELRFYGKTSSHNRTIHFKTSFAQIIDYIKTGTGSFFGINNRNYTPLAGHNSILPGGMRWGYFNQGDLALTNFPFYRPAQSHWGIKAGGIRWEVDDYITNNNNIQSTIHRVWVRGGTPPSYPMQSVTIQLDATGNATLTPADYGLNPVENCGGTITQTLSKTNFDCTAIGAHTIQLSATDQRGNTSTIDVKVIVEDTNLPVMNCITPFILQLDASGKAVITASDINNGSVDNCGIAMTSIDTKTFDCSHIGDNTITLTVTDTSGNVNTCTTIVTIEDTIPPVANCVVPFTVQLDVSGKASITVSDINNGSTDNCSIAMTTIDKTIFDCSHIGDNTVALTVTDTSGNVNTCSTIVTIEDTIVPVANCVTPFTVQLDTSGMAVITVSDIDNGSTDNCSIGSINIDKTTFDCSHIGNNKVTLTVTDTSGNINTCSTIVTIEDTIPPVANCVAPFTVQLDASGSAMISAQDIDLGSIDECNLASIQIDQQTFTHNDIGQQTITLTVTDNGGNTASCTTTVTVVDSTSPVITLLGEDPHIVILGDAYIESGAVTDDGSLVTIDSSDYKDELGEYSIRYSATDASGNRAEVTRTVIVKERDQHIFEIYPNPAIDYFIIIGSKDMYFFETYDNAGRKIKSYTKEFIGKRIPVYGYPPGIYWVKAYFWSKDSEYRQIMIKNR